jgi:hypothetical protein
MTRLAVVAVLVLAISVSRAAAGTGKYPSSSGATAAFGSVLHHRYGKVKGYWTCPAAEMVTNHGLSCLAEVSSGATWHQASAVAYLKHGRVRIAGFRADRWRRHWWPYSRRFILRSREPQVPGVISVNSPAYDWGWLAMCAHSLKGRSGACDALDGDGSGLARFYTYACSGTRPVICRNKLGDVMRYRP